MATPSSYRSATPSAVASHRRSSISSVASSERRRKEASLMDIAGSLGHPTPERSQASDDGASTRSRQLVFDVDVDGQGEQSDADSEEDAPVQVNDTDEQRTNSTGGRSKRGKGRRDIVFWTAREEECLRDGVKKYGVGSWKKILEDGRDVFLSRRTNMDLKDKWKNLCRIPVRKRRKTLDDNNQRSSPQSSSDEISEISSPEVTAPRPRRRAAAAAAERAMANTRKNAADAESDPTERDSSSEEEVAGSNTVEERGSERLSRQVTLKFATDQSFPDLVETNISLDSCKDVSALKEHLRSSVLSTTAHIDIQIIGLTTRALCDDEALLSNLIRTNGVDFFLVFSENPEEFV